MHWVPAKGLALCPALRHVTSCYLCQPWKEGMIAFHLWIKKLKNRDVQSFATGAAKEEANLGETRIKRLHHTQQTRSHQVRTLVPFQFGTDGGWTIERAPVSKESTAWGRRRCVQKSRVKGRLFQASSVESSWWSPWFLPQTIQRGPSCSCHPSIETDIGSRSCSPNRRKS